MKERSQIGLYLGRLIFERNMDQSDLAKACGVSPQYLSEIFLGRKNLGPRSIPKIVAALGTTKRNKQLISHRLHFLAAVQYGFIVKEF